MKKKQILIRPKEENLDYGNDIGVNEVPVHETKQSLKVVAPDSTLELYETPVILEKKVFGTKKTKENLNTDFNELSVKKFNIKDFFILYKQLFYDIPKKGIYSHQKIIDTSLKYIGRFSHPKNDDIDNLYEQIRNALDKLKEIEGRHSIIQNNSIIKIEDTDKHFYIQDYKKRQILIDIADVKEYMGYPRDADIITSLAQNAVDLILTGGTPIRKSEDLENPIKINNSLSGHAKARLINDYGSVSIEFESEEAIEEDNRTVY